MYDKFLREYSTGDFESDIPPVNWGYLFFVKIDNGSIIITNNFHLYQIFKKHYSQQFLSFQGFLCSLYKGETILQKEYIDEAAFRNRIVFKNETSFENSDISELRKVYFNDSDYLKTNVNLTENKVFSLLYHFFKNEYYVFYDDYSGSYSIRNGEKKIKK